MAIPEETREIYRTEFNRFDEAKIRNGIAFDHIVYAVSTGAFALSISYVVGLNKTPISHPFILIMSWVFLLVALFSHAYSYWVGVDVSDYMQKQLVSWRKNNFLGQAMTTEAISKKNKMDKKMMWCNKIATIALILGVSCLLLFSVFQLGII